MQHGGCDCRYKSVALGAFAAAKQLEKKIPKDVELFGYDDVPWMEAVRPAFSTVRQPIATIASSGSEALFARLADKPATSQTMVIDSELVIRESCGCGEKRWKDMIEPALASAPSHG